MKKIVHFTDTHLGYKKLHNRFQEVILNLRAVKQPAKDYVILITGDIVDNAFNEQSFVEAQSYVQMLEAEGYTVLVVPGNHDYGNGIYGLPKFVPIFKRTFFGSKDVEYPKLDLIDNVAFIGLDSMAEEIGWSDRLFAEGELGEPQLRRLQDMLGKKKVKEAKKTVVYLHHHPFDPVTMLQLKDSDELGEVLKSQRIDAILFGHRHKGRKWNGYWGIPRAYDGGTTTRKQGAPNPHRIIDLERDPRWDYDAEFLL